MMKKPPGVFGRLWVLVLGLVRLWAACGEGLEEGGDIEEVEEAIVIEVGGWGAGIEGNDKGRDIEEVEIAVRVEVCLADLVSERSIGIDALGDDEIVEIRAIGLPDGDDAVGGFGYLDVNGWSCGREGPGLGGGKTISVDVVDFGTVWIGDGDGELVIVPEGIEAAGCWMDRGNFDAGIAPESFSRY